MANRSVHKCSPAQALINTLTHASDFLTVQARVCPDSADKLRDAHCISFIKQIESLGRIDVTLATRLSSLVDGGDWGADRKRDLCKAIATACSVDAQSGRTSQHIATVELYFTARDWNIICDAATPLSAKLGVVAVRMKNMGVRLPDEQTKGRVAQILKFKGHGCDETKDSLCKLKCPPICTVQPAPTEHGWRRTYMIDELRCCLSHMTHNIAAY